ncbi:MAG: flagellar biosynthesis protein [Novosphingobium sp.]|nr:flagellar biosynthesis protein [Novosphingobium sp.]
MSEFTAWSPLPSGAARANLPHPSIPSPDGEWKIDASATASAQFRPDTRFSKSPVTQAAPVPEPEPEDPLVTAYSEGFAAGMAEVEAIARQQREELVAAQEALKLSFTRLDEQLEEELRLRLRDTVAALCEAAIAPLALDEDALARRIVTAVSMLARADDERVIRLHPDDLDLVSQRLSAEWQVEPDPTLERGAVRVETATGGVEDGPGQWRRAIAEALHQC